MLKLGNLARQSLQTSSLLALRIVTQATTLVLLARIFNPEVYGNIAAVMALAVVMGTLSSLGTGYVMLATAGKDASALARIWSYAWPLTLVLGVALLGLFVALSPLIHDTSILPSWSVVAIGSAEILPGALTTLLSFSLQARERVPLSQLVQWLPLGLRLIAIAPCLVLPPTERLNIYVDLQLLTSILATFISYKIAQKHLHFDWRARWPSIEDIKTGASYAAVQIIAVSPTELDKALSVRAIGAHAAGIYSASSRIMGAMVTPVTALLLTAQPRLFKNASRRDYCTEHLVKVIGKLALGWGLVSMLLLILGSPLLPQILGVEYASTSRLLPFTALIAPALSLRIAAGSILVALGRPQDRLALELGGVTLITAGTIFLSKLFGIGGFVGAVLLAETAMASAGWILIWRSCPSTPKQEQKNW